MSTEVTCPVCSRKIFEKDINHHLDTGCAEDIDPASKARRGPPRTQPRTQASIASLFGGTQKPHAAPAGPSHAAPTSKAHGKKRVQADENCTSAEPGPSKRPKTASVPSTMTSRMNAAAPLAERLRPTSLEEFVGQPQLTGPDSLLLRLLDSGSTGSIIFWGPPGCGKTTLARLLAKRTNAVFKELSATDSGIADVRAVVEEAKNVLTLTGRRTILFLDEVHRFNKAQQDIFLPFLEQGQLQLIGATTENPSFKLTGALISRVRVFVLERLTDEDITKIVIQAVDRVSSNPPPAAYAEQATEDEPDHNHHHSGIQSSQPESEEVILPPSSPLTPISTADPASSCNTPAPPQFPAYPHLTPKLLSSLVSLSTGDARTALSLLELVLSAPPSADPDALLSALRRSVSTSYDRTGESHYDMISALHKSVRGSQPSAALYWLARMLTAGEDPLYIARRMVVCASEDIGLADNHALPLAMAAFQACQMIGMPECRINLAHLVSYLSEAPKSTRAYVGYNRAEAAAKSDPTAPVPLPMRNAPTKLMKELGYARGYCYNPDYAHPVTNDYLPPRFKDEGFLLPAGDMTGKSWDEEALRSWEIEENEGLPWEGRQYASQNAPNSQQSSTKK